MEKLKKGKIFFYEQSSLIGIFILIILLGRLLNLKILNFIVVRRWNGKMEKLKKGKIFFYEQSSLIGIFILIILLGRLLNLKILNFIVVPAIISFLAYHLLKIKLVNIEIEKLNIKEKNYNEKIEEINNIYSEKAKKIIYKYFINIYIFYIEYSILEIPNIFLLGFLIVTFILILTYLKTKKTKYYKYKNTFIYGFFAILFFIPIINKIVKFINK